MLTPPPLSGNLRKSVVVTVAIFTLFGAPSAPSEMDRDRDNRADNPNLEFSGQVLAPKNDEAASLEGRKGSS